MEILLWLISIDAFFWYVVGLVLWFAYDTYQFNKKVKNGTISEGQVDDSPEVK